HAAPDEHAGRAAGRVLTVRAGGGVDGAGVRVVERGLEQLPLRPAAVGHTDAGRGGALHPAVAGQRSSFTSPQKPTQWSTLRMASLVGFSYDQAARSLRPAPLETS